MPFFAERSSDTTIHGLWPNYENGKWPAFCNSSYPFDIKEVESLLPELNNYWPELISGKSKSYLWAHEWSKHGTCSAPVLNGELEYFSKALDLRNDLDPMSFLAKIGFVPSDTQTYWINDVEDALGRFYGDNTDFTLSCLGGDGEYSDLYQIELCLQKDFQVRSCGGTSRSNCVVKIRIPSSATN